MSLLCVSLSIEKQPLAARKYRDRARRTDPQHQSRHPEIRDLYPKIRGIAPAPARASAPGSCPERKRSSAVSCRRRPRSEKPCPPDGTDTIRCHNNKRSTRKISLLRGAYLPYLVSGRPRACSTTGCRLAVPISGEPPTRFRWRRPCASKPGSWEVPLSAARTCVGRRR